jgi:beta-xylosidase
VLPAPTLENPVLSGWSADPEARNLGHQFWIYSASPGPEDQQVSFDAFCSEDLVSWTRHPQVLAQGAVPWATRALRSPSVLEKDGRYFLFFSATDLPDDGEGGGIGVAVSDTPDGPFTDAVGAPLLGAFRHGARPVDPFVFQDRDGQAYLIHGGAGHCNLARLREDCLGLEPFADGSNFVEITPDHDVGSPCMFLRQGRYYLLWTEGGADGESTVAYAMADSPRGPFRHRGEVLRADPEVAASPGHATVLELPGDGGFALVYDRRPLRETDPDHRVVCIERITFDADGSLEPVTLTFDGPPVPR